MILQHLGGEYDSISEMVEDIYKELERLQPIDSDTIKHTISSNGVISHAITPSSAKSNRGVQLEDSIVYDTKTDHQFKISDASLTSEDGTIIPRVHVTAGVLNGVFYNYQHIVISSGKFWIYAVNGAIYALNHEFASDFFPVLLCGTVEVDEEMNLTIEQISFQDNPFVQTCGVEFGAIVLSGSLSHSDYTITAEYTVSAQGLLNNKVLESPATKIPESTSGHLLAYIKSLDVEADSQPESGFEFSDTGQPTNEVAWYQDMFRYTLSATTFKVLFRQQPVQMFTFTRIFLNASETEENANA